MLVEPLVIANVDEVKKVASIVMKIIENQLGMALRFACGFVATFADLVLPAHPPGLGRRQIEVTAIIALVAVIALTVQMCRGQLWHRILAFALLLVAGSLAIGMAQEWAALPR